ncbi:rRNA maturation RNase YbeY [Gloeobacter kilaueensis]|uniref:Endoribonuclease YbeY n=1 Tax=Gloeobacter kilaueensis (strain ATCC BAA-2537 / CCAP 1431/1 / ULC 316 / JS1) TaxID=1183438 RepID=U5QF81_GLOK1|nr:rRNA maturation RNase YbeY [Gloeobacter kilaueensis]AGY57596.1 metalloprotease [Gloeobacter kilaueensis JS1]
MAVLPLVMHLNVQAVVPDPLGEAVWQRWFTAWLSALRPAEPVELTLRLVDDEEIRQLNACFRELDAVTDVLAFEAGPVLEPAVEGEPFYLGDIVLSVPRATGQANQFGHAIEAELGWLAVHGLLHLLGWDHPDEAAWQAMVTKQAELLKGVNVEYDWPSVYPIDR